MGVQISPDSETGKQLRVWETPVNQNVVPDALPGDPWYEVKGRRAVGYQEFPKLLYRALPNPRSGKVECYQGPPDPFFFATQPEYDRAVQEVENFNRRCTLKVLDESQERRALTDGWRRTITDALAQYEQQQRAIGDEAARRAYTDQRMSERAQAEMAAIEAETHEHVASKPVAKKRPYRRKVTPTPTTE